MEDSSKTTEDTIGGVSEESSILNGKISLDQYKLPWPMLHATFFHGCKKKAVREGLGMRLDWYPYFPNYCLDCCVVTPAVMCLTRYCLMLTF